MLTATFTSKRLAFGPAHREAALAALPAAGKVTLERWRALLAGGFTSGAFVTGESAATTGLSAPSVEGGVPTIRLGTSQRPPVIVFWELGHHNRFTGKYERVETLRPAIVETRDASARAYNAVYTRELAAAMRRAAWERPRGAGGRFVSTSASTASTGGR